MLIGCVAQNLANSLLLLIFPCGSECRSESHQSLETLSHHHSLMSVTALGNTQCIPYASVTLNLLSTLSLNTFLFSWWISVHLLRLAHDQWLFRKIFSDPSCLFWSLALCTDLRHSRYSSKKGRLCRKTDMVSNPALHVCQEIVGTLREFNWREFDKRTIYRGVDRTWLLRQPCSRTCLPLLPWGQWSHWSWWEEPELWKNLPQELWLRSAAAAQTQGVRKGPRW